MMSPQPHGSPPRRVERRDKMLREREHDPYKQPGKLPDPTACPGCGALFRAGRWTWGAAPADARQTLCPACQRTADDYPAGILQLSGPFVAAHREELLGLARNVEEREKREHPLKRILAIQEEGGDTLVITTDAKLARSIGDAIHRAYQGELEHRYGKDERPLRIAWRR